MAITRGKANSILGKKYCMQDLSVVTQLLNFSYLLVEEVRKLLPKNIGKKTLTNNQLLGASFIVQRFLDDYLGVCYSGSYTPPQTRQGSWMYGVLY
jgi:hypothetical protein